MTMYSCVPTASAQASTYRNKGATGVTPAKTSHQHRKD